jgi:hypothetical protein
MFECYIIYIRLNDICRNKELVGGIKFIYDNVKKSEIFDNGILREKSETYLSDVRWDLIQRLKSSGHIESMNTSTGIFVNNIERYKKWSVVKNSLMYEYTEYIIKDLCRVSPSKVNYTAGMDVISDIEYFIFGSIYNLMKEDDDIDVHDLKSIAFLSMLAKHLELKKFMEWKRDTLREYFYKQLL